LARLLLTRLTAMRPPVRTAPAAPARRVARASLVWACALASAACATSPLPAARAPAPLAAPSVVQVPEAPAPATQVTAPPATEPPLPASADSLPEAIAVVQARSVLRAFPAPGGDCPEVPVAVVRAMRRMRTALNDYLARALATDVCGSAAAPASIAACLEARLRDAGVVRDDGTGDDDRWGDLGPITVDPVPERPTWLVVTTSLAFDVSEDARVMLYQRGVGPRIVEPVEDLQGVRAGHVNTHAWAWIDDEGAPLLLVASQDEWCMSRWRLRRLTLLQARRDPRRPREVWARSYGIDIESSDGLDGRPPPDGLTVAVDDGGISLEWHARWARLVERNGEFAAQVHGVDARVRLVRGARGGVREASRSEHAWREDEE